MKLLNANRWFLGILLLMIFVIVGISIAIVLNALRLNDLEKRFVCLKSELKSLLTLDIDISSENVEFSNENLREVYEFRKKWLNSFGMASSSLTPIECYLNLGRDVQSVRNAALLENVTINSKCYLGFAKYLGTEKLPNHKSIVDLDRQSLIIKIIANALIEAAPKEILFIKRESVDGELDRDDDIFILPFQQRLKIHDIFYSNAFKLSFVGTTQTLRSFLNEMESMASPIFINYVEINRYFDDKNSIMPIEEYSVFLVILEIFNIKEPVT